MSMMCPLISDDIRGVSFESLRKTMQAKTSHSDSFLLAGNVHSGPFSVLPSAVTFQLCTASFVPGKLEEKRQIGQNYNYDPDTALFTVH
jgi:hypothetical protein